jgi:hypothetical protein
VPPVGHATTQTALSFSDGLKDLDTEGGGSPLFGYYTKYPHLTSTPCFSVLFRLEQME